MPLIDYSFLGKIIPKAKYKKDYRTAKQSYLNRIRWAVSVYYFAMGLGFSSWASRIPDIKNSLHISEGTLGTILFALPLGQLVTMSFSGKWVAKYGSYSILTGSLLGYVICLTNLGLATKSWQLALGLFFFGVFSNLCNIAVNTQGVYTEVLFKKTIMSSFHGAWSIAGFFGALLGLGMLAIQITPFRHFLIIALLVLVLMVFNYNYLIKVKAKSQATSSPFFSKPDRELIGLGVVGFCCMASEGVMFDWSGVYFKEVIKAPGALTVLGYTSFMVMMATGRFVADYLVHQFGAKKVLQLSGCVISIGLYIAVLFPYIIPSTLAFMMVGMGVSSIVPTVYSLAGKNKTLAPSVALTIVSSISFFGFLMGPPVIGYIAEVTSLKYSFAFIGVFGFFITFLVTRMKSFE